ncbi:MAG: hypothetical protein PHH60_03545 [Candidatus Margulisbacteria bacterium]|nr:hypothetical protein [Candidatus Margulisiibacteriota bacterium]
MAEERNPAEIGRAIAGEYLSKRGWALEWRRTLNRQLYPGFQREEFEEKEKRCDQMEEEAEEIFSRNVERWRHRTTPEAQVVLQSIVKMLGKRNDLGFFAKKIVGRLKTELGSI